jgi:hypothetical protein
MASTGNSANRPNMRNIAISAITDTALRSAGNIAFADLRFPVFIAATSILSSVGLGGGVCSLVLQQNANQCGDWPALSATRYKKRTAAAVGVRVTGCSNYSGPP